MNNRTSSFYQSISPFHDFGKLMDPSFYSPFPDDWIVGIADIVQSTQAIAERRYKAVNMAGAAVIAALTNALAGEEFPFVFGGDGASFAVSPADIDLARDALAATAAWVNDDLGLTMRASLIPLKTIRTHGLDVQVARYAPSANVSYAMFSGGGLAWAEAATKRDEFAVPAAPAGTQPDLSGLSCRFEEIPSVRGLILSVLVVARDNANPERFRRTIETLVELVDQSPDGARPVPPGGPGMRWPPAGLDYEARAAQGRFLVLNRVKVLGLTFVSYLIMRLGITVGGFVPRTYIEQVVANSDFRKYDDGLRMILDCTPALASDIERLLSLAAADGVLHFGLHQQDAAMMTCFTPSPLRSDHVHFIDGARGGYASAATALKTARL